MAHCLYWMVSDTLKHMLLRHTSPLYCKQCSGFWLQSALALLMKHGPSKYSDSSASIFLGMKHSDANSQWQPLHNFPKVADGRNVSVNTLRHH